MKLTINENMNVTVEEFVQAVKDIYARHFPDSTGKIGLVKRLGRAIFMDFYLAKDEHELFNGYWENDMFKCGCVIHLPDGTDNTSPMPETITLQSMGSEIRTKPPVRYLAYGSVKVPFRKTTGNSSKVLAYIDKYASRIVETLNNLRDEDYVSESDEEIVARKINDIR